MKRLLSVVAATLVIVGCGKDHPANPVVPAVAPPPATYAVTGNVSTKNDAGEAPLDGVQIDLFDGVSHHTTQSDSAGHYSVDGLAAGQWSITASKDGFVSQTNQLQLASNASMDFELQAVAAPAAPPSAVRR